jgi:hypothetical protein
MTLSRPLFDGAAAWVKADLQCSALPSRRRRGLPRPPCPSGMTNRFGFRKAYRNFP